MPFNPFDRRPPLEHYDIEYFQGFLATHTPPRKWYENQLRNSECEVGPEVVDWLEDYFWNELRRSATSKAISMNDPGLLNYTVQAIVAIELNKRAEAEGYNLSKSKNKSWLSRQIHSVTRQRYVGLYQSALTSVYCLGIAIKSWEQKPTGRQPVPLQTFRDFQGLDANYWTTQSTAPVQYNEHLAKAGADFLAHHLKLGMGGGVIQNDWLLTQVARVIQLSQDPDVTLEELSEDDLYERMEDAVLIIYPIMLALYDKASDKKSNIFSG